MIATAVKSNAACATISIHHHVGGGRPLHPIFRRLTSIKRLGRSSGHAAAMRLEKSTSRAVMPCDRGGRLARGSGNRPQGWPFSDVALRPGSGTRTAGSPDGGGIGGALRDLAAASTRLIGEHLLLARIELREDVRVLGGQLARIALFAPLLMVGHALVCSALAVLLAQWIGTAAALLVIGIPNLADQNHIRILPENGT